MPLFSFEGKRPVVHPTAFVAPTAVLVGDVTVEERASVWYNAVLRADFNPIVVRAGANVQDCSVVHVTPRSGVEIGAGATIGHNCTVHAATIGEEALVVQEGVGRAVVQHPAPPRREQHRAVPELLGHRQVVGRGDDGEARHVREHVDEEPDRGRVEARGGLVEEEDARLDREQRRERDALLLAARQLERRALEERRDVERLGPPGDARLHVREPELARPEGELVAHGGVEEHGVDVLEEERDLAAEAAPERRLVERRGGEPPPGVAHLARVGEAEAVEEAQQRRLPAAVHAEDDEPLAGGHLERDVLQHGAAAERHGDAIDGEVTDRVKFIEGDLFTADISAATVVTLFLSPEVNRRLLPKLRRELRPGTRIVSHQFRLGSWPPAETVRAEDGTNLFLWIVPTPASREHPP